MPLINQDFSDSERMDGIAVSPTKANGSPATLDGPVTLTVQTGDVTTEVAANGTFSIISGTAGAYEVRVDGDADLGSGVVTISDTIAGTISGGQAVNLGLTAGTINPK